MRRENAVPLLLVGLLLALAAVGGYFAGQGHSGSTPVEAVRDASSANALLEYPQRVGWDPAPRVPTIAGLAITQPLVLAPGGNPSNAGLVAGQLANDGWSPVPTAFLAHTRELPKAEVVELENTEAYRYSGVETGSPASAFTLYTVPTSGPTQVAVVCYAPASEGATLRTCEGIAGSLTVTYPAGSAPIDDLVPQPAYAQQISAALARVNQLRSGLRAGVGGTASQSTVAALSLRAAYGVNGVLGSLSLVHPPAAAEQVNAALLRSLSSAGDAYSDLAAAARAGEQSAYAQALARVVAGEGNLNTVLGAFTLLGYG
jgi:hypothetical protein